MLAEQTAVVTGSARGIGQAIAQRLASDGARVVVLDVADGSETVDSIRALGGDAEFVDADVTDADAMAAAFEGREVDVLVNNAAYFRKLLDDPGRFDDIDEAEWDTVMDVNVKGTFLASKYALPRMNEEGSIVNLSSNTVNLGVPGMLHYVTSKAAVVGLTRAMANELGELDIRVNAVMPGITASETILQGYESGYLEQRRQEQAIQRTIEPADIADAVAFLAGPDSRMVTGQVLTVDGGISHY